MIHRPGKSGGSHIINEKKLFDRNTVALRLGSSASPILNLSKTCEGNAANEEKETTHLPQDARDIRDGGAASASDDPHSPRRNVVEEDHSEINDDDDDDEEDKHGKLL